jgi:hypothetical protein
MEYMQHENGGGAVMSSYQISIVLRCSLGEYMMYLFEEHTEYLISRTYMTRCRVVEDNLLREGPKRSYENVMQIMVFYTIIISIRHSTLLLSPNTPGGEHDACFFDTK